MRQIRVTTKQAARLQRQRKLTPPPPVIEGLLDTGEPAFTGGSRPGYTTHRLEKEIPCPDCGHPTRDLYQKIDGTQIGRAVCITCDGTLKRKKR